MKYHSLKRGAADREVVPHALVDSGLRWHARVFDRQSNEFRDLVISRIPTKTSEKRLPESTIYVVPPPTLIQSPYRLFQISQNSKSFQQ